MEITNYEKKFRNIISHFLIVLVIVIVAAVCFIASYNSNSAIASNSEYNGTIYAGDKNSKNVSLMIK